MDSKASLEGFYQWTVQLGHYSATEAVERYRKMMREKESDNGTKNEDRDSNREDG